MGLLLFKAHLIVWVGGCRGLHLGNTPGSQKGSDWRFLWIEMCSPTTASQFTTPISPVCIMWRFLRPRGEVHLLAHRLQAVICNSGTTISSTLRSVLLKVVFRECDKCGIVSAISSYRLLKPFSKRSTPRLRRQQQPSLSPRRMDGFSRWVVTLNNGFLLPLSWRQLVSVWFVSPLNWSALL